MPVWTDEPRKSYRLLEFKRGVGGILSLGAVKNAVRAFSSGFRQKKVQGDAMQLGGVLVVQPGGEIAYRQASESAGDHPPPDEVIAVLRRPAA